LPDEPFYVTTKVLYEIGDMIRIGRMSSDVISRVKAVVEADIPPEVEKRVRAMAFDKGKPKDPISPADVEMIGVAMVAAQHGFPVEVRSRDSHITRTTASIIEEDKVLARRLAVGTA
jgi:hypothetical protein